MNLIGISGKKRTGKDTVADILVRLHPNTIKYYFAAPLKQEVARACGVSVEYIDAHKANFRLILQGWGTNFRRDLHDKNYWVRKMEIAIAHLEKFNTVVIPDVRFKNEYDFIKKNGGKVLRVSRATGMQDTHPSETELDKEKFDEIILNDSTIDHLIEQVVKIKIN